MHNNRYRLVFFTIILSLVCLVLSAVNPGKQIITIARAEEGSGIYLPLVAREISQQDINDPNTLPPDQQQTWFDRLNFYRSLANLPRVAQVSAWSDGDQLHSRYMVKNDVVMHSEDSRNRWFSEAGNQAAQMSNLIGADYMGISDKDAIDLWMQAPFHALGILDPGLVEAGYGSYREDDGGLTMGAALDVLRGLHEIPEAIEFPVVWPADGMIVSLTTHFSEYPNPLSSCPGYSVPSGLPIILQIGSGSDVPRVSNHSFTSEGKSLEHCVFDETNYSNPDRGAQDLARNILNARDAVVLIPKDPLQLGVTYTVSITVNGSTIKWSFQVANADPQVSPLSDPSLLLGKIIID
jgi:uncharacterized protein YkwD